MRSSGWIVLIIIVFIFGITVGYFFSPFAPSGSIQSSIIQVGTLVGLGLAIYKAIRDYFKENVFDYDGVYKKLEFREGMDETGFYLRIKKKRGGGGLEKCEGLLTMQEPNGKKIHIPTVWYGTDFSRYRDVSVQDDLKLFHLSKDGQSLFLFPHYEETPSQNPSKYYERKTSTTLNSTISVTFGANRGNVPKKPFKKTINDIIRNAGDESPKMINV